MTRKLLTALILGSTLLLSCSTFNRQPSSTKGRHLILTLHGVRGTEASFGDFHRVIKAHLESVDPNYEVIPLNFTYPTGQDNYDPKNIAPSINERILKELSGQLRETDKISVIGYSMGGQVMAHWYMETMANKETAPIAEATQNLIGLGAPFWGSKHASITLGFKDDIDGLVHLGQMSGNEVRSLAILSNSSMELRQKMIKWHTDPALRSQFHPRILSIAGIYPCVGKDDSKKPGCGSIENAVLKAFNEDLLKTRFSGLVRRETDMVVVVPSARMDFVYYKDSAPSAENVAASQFQDISKISSTQMQIAESLHAGDGKYLTDMVIVDPSCMDASQCKHETYKYIFETLAACNQPGNSCLSSYQDMIGKLFGDRAQVAKNDKIIQDELQGFYLELNLRLPSQYKLNEKLDSDNILKYIKFNREKGWMSKLKGMNPFSSESNRVVTGQPVEFEVGRKSEIGSKLVSVITNKQGETEVRIALSGRFSVAPNYTLKGEGMKNFVETVWGEKAPVLPFTVSFPGLKERKIESRVRPTTSTYVDLSLTR